MSSVVLNTSPLEIFLSSKRKRTSVQRWLEDGSIINLSIKEKTSNNAEFIVNGNPNHLIWYSQLTEIFLSIEEFVLYTGDLIYKNGIKIPTKDLDLDKFVKFVSEGRKFRVVTNPDGKVAKLDREFCGDMPYFAVAEKVKSLSEEGKYSEAVKYLLPATQYTLYEL